MVTVVLPAVLPEMFTVVLGTEHVMFTKLLETEQENVTGPLKLLIGVTVMVAVCELPG